MPVGLQPDADGMVPHTWTFDHEIYYQAHNIEYKPAHLNEYKCSYDGNPFFGSMTPRFQECVLAEDELNPLPALRSDMCPLLDDWFMDLSAYNCLAKF